jgi:hypothetical protein
LCDKIHVGKYCQDQIFPVSLMHFIAAYERILINNTVWLCCLCLFLCVTKTFRTDK